MTKSSNKHLVLFGLCLLVAFTILVPETANAQVLYGSVSGNVLDPTGAAIPEPSTLVLTFIGLVSIGVMRRKA